MIGKAALGFIPSNETRIMQGAYRPIPSGMSAPKSTLPAIAVASLTPVTPNRSPPPGTNWSWVRTRTIAAASSADPIPIWILRRGQWQTTPAPNHDPTTDAPIIATSVITSTSTKVM